MVSQKRSDFEPSARQVSAMPHIPKSARGKRSSRKKENQMCAIDLLATVAGKLLTEGEDSPFLANIKAASTSCPTKGSVKQEQFDEVKPLKTEVLDQDSCNESTFVPNMALLKKADPQSPLEAASMPAPVLVKPDTWDKEYGCNFAAIPDRWSPDSVESGHCGGGDGRKGSGSQMASNGVDKIVPDLYNVLDPMDLDTKPPPLVSSDSSGGMPLYDCDHIRRSSSFPRGRQGMDDLVDRDDDDNSSGCTHPGTAGNKGFKTRCIGDRSRVKKFLGCKFRKVAPARMHKGALSYSDVERKPAFRSKRMYYTRQRTQRSTFKRRKLLDHRSVVTSEGFANSNANGTTKVAARDSHAASLEANKATTSCQKSSCQSKGCNVKLSIKSFKVPDLLVEIPENATVGSLKRTVLEAVNAILGGALRVGVLHLGKKIRDDNKTLLQAGITNGDKLDNLGFSLEPNYTQAQAQALQEPGNAQFIDADDTTESLARIPPADQIPKQEGQSDDTLQLALTPIANCHESDHDSVHSPVEISAPNKVSANSRAIVPFPSKDADAVAGSPLQKTKRPELGQRRIRRPFSVGEVEALVQAVEKLGTGRWRDVKIRAFDNAKHRTYVDLKDKWKTLVHTASISPQQRRGEPVPQELLDRVLATQAYWSQQQARLQQPKTPPLTDACLLT